MNQSSNDSNADGLLMVETLVEGLGKPLTAFIAGVSEATVAKWVSAELVPPSISRGVLRAAAQAFNIVAAADSAALARAWFVGTNPELGED